MFLHEATRERQDIDLRHTGSFGRDILTMVDGLNKIATIKPKDTRLEADNYKKLIVSYSTDPRVVVLKLADRLEVMRSLELFPKASRERKQLETLLLYIPLAHQLGLYNMKSEMEDIYFKYAEPEEYRAITNRLKATERDRQVITKQFIEPRSPKPVSNTSSRPAPRPHSPSGRRCRSRRWILMACMTCSPYASS